jgi:diacylglycerol kinase (ATP)
MQLHIAVICNPTKHNAKALRIADAVSILLQSRNIAHSIFTTYWPTTWQNFSNAWIIGGDGTLHHFINQYPDLSIPISIFNGGTANDFHWMMYGKIGLEDQFNKLLNSKPTFIDAGTCNGRLFINGAGIGFDGAIVKDVIGKTKFDGKLSYMFSILKNVVFYKEYNAEIILENATVTQKCFMINVANGKRYGGGFNVTPKASVTDGLLDINIVGKVFPLKRIRYLPVIEKGKHLDLPFVLYKQESKVYIKSDRILDAHLDGEYFSASEFNIECLPKKILFVV